MAPNSLIVFSRPMKLFFRLIIVVIISLTAFACDELPFTNSDSKEGGPDVALFPVQVNGSFGYIDQDGRMAIAPRFQNAGDFSEGLAPVRESWRWHFINADGEIAIDGKGSFQEIREFHDGRAAVRIEGRWGYLNPQGEFAINPRFRSNEPFSEGIAFVRSLNYRRWHYIDRNGNDLGAMLNPMDMDPHDFTAFSNQRALVKDNNLYAYIDDQMQIVVDFSYAEAQPFGDGLAAVKISDRWGYIDVDGQLAIDPKFISAGVFNEGLAPVRLASNQFGYANTQGELAISEQFDAARPFYEERAVVQQDGLWGVIDRQGNWVVQPTFIEMGNFDRGLARIIDVRPTADNDGEERFSGYINRDGAIVWYPTR